MSEDGETMVAATELGRLQRWMQAAVTDRAGITGGRSAGNPPGDVEEIVLPSASLTSGERLAIYARSYHARLLQCFATIFPSLLHALGRELFEAFALDYLHHHPPHSHTLDHLADAFPDHLAATRPDAGLPADRRETWPDFIIDLARLELVLLHVFNGDGVENATPPLPRDIASVPLHLVGRLVPAPAASSRVLRFGYPVHEYLRACRRGEMPTHPAARECSVVISRRNYRVLINEISPWHCAFLHEADGGRTVEELLQSLAAQGVEDPRGVHMLRDVLCEWASWCVLARV
ncbi:MAG TPA: DNA-binding domain-containing protein [Candidatus Kapabacteria bacterium]|nr:DNA-binding domain-containing protein [Candidatus Kapabacteria bacterium]